MIDKRWKVYAAGLKPEFPTKIIEIHTVEGETVIPWAGFDNDGHRSYAMRLRIARLIVRLHNEDLNRQANLRRERGLM